MSTSPYDFRISIEKMISTSITKQNYLEEDQAELEARGITKARLDAFSSSRNAFLLIPSDKVQEQLTIKANDLKDQFGNSVRIQIKDILGIVETTFGLDSTEYKSFGISAISTIDTDGIYQISQNVLTQCQTYKTELTAKGLTPDQVGDLTKSRTELYTLINKAITAKTIEKQVTDQRHAAGNALWKELKDMCSIGSKYFGTRNKAKAKRYVLYGSKANTERTGTVAANKIVSPKEAKIAIDTPFEIQVYEGTSLQFYFSLTKKEKPGTKITTVLFNPNIYTPTTAGDLGYDPDKGVIFLNVFNPNKDVAKFIIKIG